MSEKRFSLQRAHPEVATRVFLTFYCFFFWGGGFLHVFAAGRSRGGVHGGRGFERGPQGHAGSAARGGGRGVGCVADAVCAQGRRRRCLSVPSRETFFFVRRNKSSSHTPDRHNDEKQTHVRSRKTVSIHHARGVLLWTARVWSWGSVMQSSTCYLRL